MRKHLLIAWYNFESKRLISVLSILSVAVGILIVGIVFLASQMDYYSRMRWLPPNVDDRYICRIRKPHPMQEKPLSFEQVEKTIRGARVDKLQEVKLFDIFESEKLGAGKKSLAISFTFLDEEKTLTDKEIDGMVNRIMGALEKEVQAEIRK